MSNSNILVVIALLMATLLSACSSFSLKLASPFKTVSDKDEQDRYLVVVTRAIYRTDTQNADRFKQLTNAVVDNIGATQGLYGYTIRKDFLGNTAWTYTIWESDTAMHNFKVSDHHLEAMKSASTVLQEAKFASTFIGPQELNYSWDKALKLLEEEGRTYGFAGRSSYKLGSDTDSSD